MRCRTIATLLAVLLVSATAVAAAGERWIHVRVHERTTDAEQVNVNLPLALVESVLPAIETEEMSGELLGLDDTSLEGVNLREVLEALRDSPDTDFIRVSDEEETVRVAKEADMLVIRVESRPGPGAEQVRVVLPLEVVEAMIDPNSDELDLAGGLQALADYDDDLLRIESDTESVRIWIDHHAEGR